MKFGVCIIALGYEIYGNCAVNLAMSLKVYQRDLSITLLCEPQAIAHLTDQEKSFFDIIKQVDEADYLIGDTKQYQRVKLCVNKYTPYDYTFYMDADNIWFDKKVSWLFGELCQKDFYIGLYGQYDVRTNKKTRIGYTYWSDNLKELCSYFNITGVLPQTVSGFYYFRKCQWVDEMFSEALSIYDDQKAPVIRWAGGKPDEYCFNVALAKKNYIQDPFDVFYFDKINKVIDNDQIYKNFWGIATGGNIVSSNLIVLYNRLVNKYCAIFGITERRYHVNKIKVVPERKTF